MVYYEYMAIRGKQPLQTDLAYIAGLIDGEGTVGIYRKNPKKPTHSWAFRERVAISNSNLKALEYVNQFFPGTMAKNTRYSEKHSPMWRLEYHVLRAVPILEAVLPYMIIKREQAELVLQYRKTIVLVDRTIVGQAWHPRLPEEEFKRREWYYYELKRLNKTGVQPQRLSEMAPQAGDAIV